jgi:hypothetical protein
VTLLGFDEWDLHLAGGGIEISLFSDNDMLLVRNEDMDGRMRRMPAPVV